jgi:pantetheine-phosphate adenylyltransferase
VLLLTNDLGDGPLFSRKSYGKMIEPYSVREQKVREFIKTLAPSLELIILPIEDIYGPAITIEDLDAIVVSTETESGATYVRSSTSH